MKTIRQEHEEEQREARLAAVHRQFVETMKMLEREHAASQKRIDRGFRTTVNVMCAVAAVALLVPVILLVIRMIIHR